MTEKQEELNVNEFNMNSMKDLRDYCKKFNIVIKREDGIKGLSQKVSAHMVELLKEEANEEIISDKTEEADISSNDDLKNIDIVYGTEEELKEAGVHDKDIAFMKTPLTLDGHKVSDVVDSCNVLFSGRAIASYDRINNPNMIEFRGNVRESEDVTIHMPKRHILMYAKTYISPARSSNRGTVLYDKHGQIITNA